jgi:hypothetical protein
MSVALVGQSRVFISYGFAVVAFEGAFPRPALEGRAVKDGLPPASGVLALEGDFVGVLASLNDAFFDLFDTEVSLMEKIWERVKSRRVDTAQITYFIDNTQIKRTSVAPIPTPS